MRPILPPATLGVMGGGQLGRYFVLAARALGYRTAVFDPDPDAPARAVADAGITAAFDDHLALDRFAQQCRAVTVELESLPASSLQRLALRCAVAPGPDAIAIGQDRLREKRFMRAIGLPTAPFREVLVPGDTVSPALFPGILKTARNGYDGKGQHPVEHPSLLSAAWRCLGGVPCVLEKRMPLQQELSVILARGRDGARAAFPVAENRHRDGILELSVAPAPIAPGLAAAASAAAARIADALGYVGVLGVEFFVSGGELIVNEYAPRPHNSGHFTLDACATSQFEQQVRALCGLPLGPTEPKSVAAMVNLIGPAWLDALRLPGARRGFLLHDYAKKAVRPGRKMGHATALAPTAAAAKSAADALLRELQRAR